jgi:hypothetical protein
MIFYRTAYKPSCFGVMSIRLDNEISSSDGIKIRFKSFPSESDELFLRFTTRLINTKLYTYDSLLHLDRST